MKKRVLQHLQIVMKNALEGVEDEMELKKFFFWFFHGSFYRGHMEQFSMFKWFYK